MNSVVTPAPASSNESNQASTPSQSATAENPWPAPRALAPLHASVTVPGSKSLSNRYLILAALGSGPVTISELLRSRDTDLMADALRALSVGVTYDAADGTRVTVTPPKSGVFKGATGVYCGLAGTVMRFVPGLAMFADGPVRFDGDEQAYARPMHPLLDGLTQLGARIDYEGKKGFLPFTLTPPDWHAGASASAAQVAIDSSASSQFVSGLLLIGSRLPHGLDLRHQGEKVPSMPHIRMTMADVNAAGGQATMPETAHWTVEHRDLRLPDGVVVEPDLSNAAPFLGAAMIAGGEVDVPNWPAATTQPGGLLPGILQHMGAHVTYGGRPYDEAMASAANGGDVPRNATLGVSMDGQIHGLGEYDLSAAGEITPSIAALATLADSPSRLEGIGHLRGHETNRLAALVTEITRIGAQAEELPDGLLITPVPADRLHGAVMESYADHRMATFGAMIGLAVDGVKVRDIATTRKTIPDFPGMWHAMLG
ncbi:3-phosphoshikimate 1-carboxyvinyltransferase [Bifidobacterium sp. ESL0763]|uniref:3-phosphoshikimate 1-carboxyvinyltransferase n=1 Tax=Bifidobacterium sp. ESL0763 TaxID=2983227 RepID=UPI0023FA083A|nr:3-phosphoshikimate 1-carboxyvinyltransferase [Bifidobacterium sp. ESL0763]MDF7663937.1 3-phosphoshikimate 1-carboxyvinyltransferase [Bifidobacterium sp. ESL0763]